MFASAILVIDAGTSSLRAVAVRPQQVTPIAAEPWSVHVPEDAAPFGREFEPAAVEASLRRLLKRAASAGAYDAVTFTGQREGLVFLDGERRALCAGPNIDARASAEGMEIDAARGEEVYGATGHLPSLMQAPAKLAWLRTRRPDVAERVRVVLPLADWLALVAGAEPAMSRSLAAENGLLDISSGTVPAHLTSCGFDPELSPQLVPDGTVVGRVAAGALAGTPVVLAGADTQCALVGSGAIEAGACAVPAGWTAPLQLVTTEPLFDAKMRTWTSVHVAPGRYILESNAGETGRAWAWACSLTGHAPAEAALLAASAPPAADDVLIVIGARTMRAAAMNAGFGGLTFPLPLVLSAPEPACVLRAVLEAAAFAIRANLEQLEEVSGARIARLGLAGGMSASLLFAQILADVIDRPVGVTAYPDATAAGAAALASSAVGCHASLADAARDLVAPARAVEPAVATSALYEDAYGRWCAMSDAFERLAAEGA